MLKVAIIGATSHVAKNLIYQNSIETKWKLFLFARNMDKLESFLLDNSIANIERSLDIADFNSIELQFDVIINCVGFGNPESIKAAGINLFYVTESIDNMILNYLGNNNGTVYINFSSGAIYGTSMDRPVDRNFESGLNVQPIDESQFYRIAKLNSEAKHRIMKSSRIIDIRLFSFFSRFIDLNGGFLLSQIVKALKEKSVFKTSNTEIYRDFISPEDLFRLVHLCIMSDFINVAIDTYSLDNVSKSAMLREISGKYNLKIEYTDNTNDSPTGLKAYYYSKNKDAYTLFGYIPEKCSMDTIIDELESMLR